MESRLFLPTVFDFNRASSERLSGSRLFVEKELNLEVLYF